MRWAALIVGIVLTVWVVVAMLTSMLVSRNPRSLVSRGVIAGVWAVMRAPLRVVGSYPRQDRWLAGAAPITVILQLAVYVVALIVSLGLVVYGTTGLSLKDSLYQSGATFTTLGIVETVNVPSAIVTFVAAFLGLVVIAVFIGYLMAIYGAYSARESQMALLSQAAGEPAWGPEALRRCHRLGGDTSAVDSDTWLGWISAIRLSHRVTPVLMHVRSPSPTRHWVIAMLAVLDATALRVALAGERPAAADVRLLAEGSVTLALLSGNDDARTCNWSSEERILAVCDGSGPEAGLREAGLTSDEWDQMEGLLVRDGVTDPASLAQARRTFCGLRSLYAPSACGLASRLHAVRAPWSGERHPKTAVEWPDPH